MKRAVPATILLLLLLVPAPGLEAVAYKCILTNNCQSPPCEFMRQLTLQRARAHAIAKVRSIKAAMRVELGWDAEIRKAKDKYSSCTGVSEMRPIDISPRPDCNIRHSGPGPTTLQEELRAARTCAELVEAEFKAAELKQALCRAVGTPESFSELKPQWQVAEQAKAKFLEQSLTRFLASCEPDATLSREIADAGLEALMSAAEKTRNEWMAERAAGGPGGGR
jgi:hypothetical protein